VPLAIGAPHPILPDRCVRRGLEEIGLDGRLAMRVRLDPGKRPGLWASMPILDWRA